MTKIIFVQPFTVNAALAQQCEGRTVVLDVAFNAGTPQGPGTPQEQFEKTTGAFINALGGKLALWLDHHPHTAWGEYQHLDPRFVLVKREHAPSCPPLITNVIVANYGEADTIVCHGDVDGIASAVTYMLKGQEAYIGLFKDTDAIDGRSGPVSKKGQWMDKALKADLRDDNVRQAIYTWLILHYYRETGSEYDMAEATIENAIKRYEAVEQATNEAISHYDDVRQRIVYVAIETVKGIDLTALLMAGQRAGEVAIVVQKDTNTATVASSPKWNFVQLFGLLGGMPNRVNLSLEKFTLEQILDTIDPTK